ncbi:MAG: methyltransferase domain-containing protein [Candidatus Uhrbacteria bacterium]|nr:methyltransferase domain-containing protein [Candidatus Uhrbacteria bacterium]
MSLSDEKARYPWLSVTTTVEEYVAPAYYDRLLKDYVFSGKTDLQIFSDFLGRLVPKEDMKVLELGCGSGRVTDVAMSWFGKTSPSLRLVDLSNQMLEFSKNRFIGRENIAFTPSDSVKFLEETTEHYDLCFSLWSFSHSVHQILTRQGLEAGTMYVRSVLSKFFTENMTPDSSFFLIHFDSMSDEQRILIKQWKKVYPIFSDDTQQSPSKRLIDDEMTKLAEEGTISFDVQHLLGEEIVYDSEDEALEIFLNFHTESYFNDSEILPQVTEELKAYFRGFMDAAGVVRIRPGCFVYRINRL